MTSFMVLMGQCFHVFKRYRMVDIENAAEANTNTDMSSIRWLGNSGIYVISPWALPIISASIYFLGSCFRSFRIGFISQISITRRIPIVDPFGNIARHVVHT